MSSLASLSLVMMMLLLPLGSVRPIVSGAEQDTEEYQATETPLLYSERGSVDIDHLEDAAHPLGREPSGKYAVVQFEGPITLGNRQELVDAGAVILDYFPDFAYVVDVSSASPSELGSLDGVRGVSPFYPGISVSPVLDESIRGNVLDNVIYPMIVVETFQGTGEITHELSRYSRSAERVSATRYVVSTPVLPLSGFLRIEGIKWIEPLQEVDLHNSISDGIMDVDEIWSTMGYDGTGQTVGIADSGLDTGVDDHGTADDIHRDFDNRVTFFNWQGSSPDDGRGHGTHVAGSVAGDGSRSSGSIRGMAPNASIVFQGIATDAGAIRTPYNLSQLFLQAYNAGARIHTNSWGSTNPSLQGTYTTTAYDADWTMYNYPDMLILFASGNDGVDTSPGDGKIDVDSTSPPATAKNIISVGASESQRTTGGLQVRWNQGWDYPYSPINSDLISDDASGLAAFSSRGPTDDGRIKPTVVAPGTNILSTKSSLSNDGWASYNNYYIYMGGTSMATPLTAGTLLLLREHLTDTLNISSPSGSLLKAFLVNGAVDLTPGQYGTNPVTQEVNRRPDNDQGWGRVSLKGSIDPDGSSVNYLEGKGGLATGENVTKAFRVQSEKELRLTLAWTDYPGTLFAWKDLVNDLDLVLKAPNGTLYHGNDLEAPFNDTRDSINPVEGITVSSPGTGWWEVKVEGYNVPGGTRQPFSLVVSGDTTDLINNTLWMDREYYPVEGGLIDIELRAMSMMGNSTVSIYMNSTSDPGGKNITLVDDTGIGIFKGYALTVNSPDDGPAEIYVRHNDTINVSFFDPVNNMTYSDRATAKVPRSIALVELPEYGLVHSRGDPLKVVGRGEIGLDVQWTLEGSSVPWMYLRDDGTLNDPFPDDGRYNDVWWIDREIDISAQLITRVLDPYLGYLTQSHFEISINTSLPSFPRGLKAVPLPEGNSLELSWNDTDERDLDYFTVHINATSGPPGPDPGDWNFLMNTTNPLNRTTVRALADGVRYWFRVSAVDENGNASSSSLSSSAVPQDIKAPEIRYIGSVGTLSGNATLIFEADEDLELLELEYYKDLNGNGRPDDNGAFFPLGNSSNGSVSWDTASVTGYPGELENLIIRWRGKDEVPNISPWRNTSGLSIDNIPPANLTLLGAPPRVSNVGSHNLMGETESYGRVDVLLNGRSTGTSDVGSVGLFHFSVDLSEGYNELVLLAYDRHGAGPLRRSYHFTLDTIGPVALISGVNRSDPRVELDPDGMNISSLSYDRGLDPDYTEVANHTWELIGPASIAEYHFGPGPISFRFEELGEYDLRLKVKDHAGNVGYDNVSILVMDTISPTVVITGPERVDEDVLVRFLPDGSTDNDPVLLDNRLTRFMWTASGPKNWTDTRDQMQFSTIFPEPGTYTLDLMITDAGGNVGRGHYRVEVADVTSPTLSIVGPGTLRRGDTGRYSADVRDNDKRTMTNGTIYWTLSMPHNSSFVRVNWTGSQIEHTFEVVGVYNLMLTVVDPSGNPASLNRTIVVNEVIPEGETEDEQGYNLEVLVTLGLAVVLFVVLVASLILIVRRRDITEEDWEDDLEELDELDELDEMDEMEEEIDGEIEDGWIWED